MVDLLTHVAIHRQRRCLRPFPSFTADTSGLPLIIAMHARQAIHAFVQPRQVIGVGSWRAINTHGVDSTGGIRIRFAFGTIHTGHRPPIRLILPRWAFHTVEFLATALLFIESAHWAIRAFNHGGIVFVPAGSTLHATRLRRVGGVLTNGTSDAITGRVSVLVFGRFNPDFAHFAHDTFPAGGTVVPNRAQHTIAGLVVQRNGLGVVVVESARQARHARGCPSGGGNCPQHA